MKSLLKKQRERGKNFSKKEAQIDNIKLIKVIIWTQTRAE